MPDPIPFESELEPGFKMVFTMIYIYVVIFVALCIYATFVHIYRTIEEYRLEMTYQSINQGVYRNKDRCSEIMNTVKNN